MLTGEFFVINLYITAPFQTTYTIKTNCKDLSFSACLKYGNNISKKGFKTDNIILAMKSPDNIYTIENNDLKFETKYPLLEIDNIIFENATHKHGVFALHGAAIEYFGQAYLFLASTTSGKTTWLCSKRIFCGIMEIKR